MKVHVKKLGKGYDLVIEGILTQAEVPHFLTYLQNPPELKGIFDDAKSTKAPTLRGIVLQDYVRIPAELLNDLIPKLYEIASQTRTNVRIVVPLNVGLTHYQVSTTRQKWIDRMGPLKPFLQNRAPKNEYVQVLGKAEAEECWKNFQSLANEKRSPNGNRVILLRGPQPKESSIRTLKAAGYAGKGERPIAGLPYLKPHQRVPLSNLFPDSSPSSHSGAVSGDDTSSAPQTQPTKPGK